jgi:hypothetical protein
MTTLTPRTMPPYAWATSANQITAPVPQENERVTYNTSLRAGGAVSMGAVGYIDRHPSSSRSSTTVPGT